MRTLILTLCVLALGLTSNAQTDKQKRYMTENAPATASRLKYYWPDSVIEALLPNLPGETWQKRLFIFSMANVESPGGLVSAKIQKGTSDDVFGILQIKQIRLQHYFDNIKMTPYCSAADLADVTKPDSVTMLLPLKILNDAVAFYKLDKFEDIAFQWNLGTEWEELKSGSTYYDRIWYSIQRIQELQETGMMAVYNRPPEEGKPSEK